jgi:hypothetical protein
MQTIYCQRPDHASAGEDDTKKESPVRDLLFLDTYGVSAYFVPRSREDVVSLSSQWLHKDLHLASSNDL